MYIDLFFMFLCNDVTSVDSKWEVKLEKKGSREARKDMQRDQTAEVI